MAKQDLIVKMAKLISSANQGSSRASTLGSCSYTDANGESYCAENWSQFQCQQVGGPWTAGGACPTTQRAKP